MAASGRISHAGEDAGADQGQPRRRRSGPNGGGLPNLQDQRLMPKTRRIKNLSMATAHPTLVIVDETKPMLRNRMFAKEFLEVGLQEGRKLSRSGAKKSFSNDRFGRFKSSPLPVVESSQVPSILTAYYRHPRNG